MDASRTARRVAVRYLKGAIKKLRVYDFDDTLATSTSHITIEKPHGEALKLDSATFAHYKVTSGDKQDFGAFNDVAKPRKIKKNFDHLRAAVAAGEDVVVLTARPSGSASAVQKFLQDEGIKGVQVVGLASSDPYDKARWISKAVKDKKYDDVEFRDDSKANTDAVADQVTKDHPSLKLNSVRVPHPKEEDYDGPPSPKSFASDNPTKAVVEVKGPEDKEKGPATSEWWKAQTPAFKEQYCKRHDKSHYCGG